MKVVLILKNISFDYPVQLIEVGRELISGYEKETEG